MIFMLIWKLKKDQDKWIKKCVEAICRMGFFSSDRSIETYAKEIWHVDECEVPKPALTKDARSVSSSNLKFSYVPQNIHGLSGKLDIYAKINKIDESTFKTILIKLGFNRNQLDKDIESFSNGQKKKVLIAKSLCEEANIYVWDEPLNYIDVFSRMQLENLLLKCKLTMIFVEHDEVFSEKIATKVIDL